MNGVTIWLVLIFAGAVGMVVQGVVETVRDIRHERAARERWEWRRAEMDACDVFRRSLIEAGWASADADTATARYRESVWGV